MSNPEHLKLLRQGVNAWNAWKNKEGSVCVDLSGADLIRANLSRATLLGVNWTPFVGPRDVGFKV